MDEPSVEPLTEADDQAPADDTPRETEPEEKPDSGPVKRIGWWW